MDGTALRPLTSKPRAEEPQPFPSCSLPDFLQDNMREIVKGRTVLIIAHRLSAVRHCHRILTIEKGRLTEDGHHDELVRTGGRYASLLRLQGATVVDLQGAR